MKKLLLTLLIWIVCFTAIVVGTVLTYQWYKDQGPSIIISFANADGLVPHQTPVVFHGVYVGWVHAIELDEKTMRALVKVQLTKQGGELIGAESKFWVVSPQLSLGHVSNLNTIATGDFIAVEPKKGKFMKEYTGHDVAPVSDQLAQGLRVYLIAADAGGINRGSSILYKGLQIGEVGELGITKDKTRILVTTYIYKEYKELVTDSSFFGNVSGFHSSIHIFGASEIGMDSMKTLVSGGIVMVTPNLGARQVDPDAEFTLITAERMQQIMSGG